MQSFAVAPVHVLHSELQVEQDPPFAKDPSGQTVPVLVDEVGGLHLVESVEESVKPLLQAVQTPVEVEHVAQPSSQTVNHVSIESKTESIKLTFTRAIITQEETACTRSTFGTIRIIHPSRIART